jgi:two-component system cell cycle response regulator
MATPSRTHVLVVARDLEVRRRIAHALGAGDDAGFDLEEVPDAATAAERLEEGSIDVVVVRLQPPDGLSAVRDVSAAAPDVPVVALLATGGAGPSAAALEAGAVDSVPEERLEPEVLRRTLRFATERSRLQRDAHRRSIVDAETDVYNARGFEHLARHHLLVADRANEPVVLVFVRVEPGSTAVDRTGLVRETASVLRRAVRDADVVGRLGADTFGVLLSGDASGHDSLVLSRIVEAVAVRNAEAGANETLSLSIGSATYDADHRMSLDDLIRTADRRMRASSPPAAS